MSRTQKCAIRIFSEILFPMSLGAGLVTPFQVPFKWRELPTLAKFTHSIKTFSWEDVRSHLSIVSFIYFIILYFIIYLFIYNRLNLNLQLLREGWWNTSTASTSIWRRRRGCSSKTSYRSSIWCHPKIGRFLRGKMTTYVINIIK